MFIFPCAYLTGNTQIICEIYRTPLPICTVATTVKINVQILQYSFRVWVESQLKIHFQIHS